MVVKLATCLKMICQRSICYVAYAWGMLHWTVQLILSNEMLGVGFEKKKYKYKGHTLLNCERKGQSFLTTFNFFVV